MAQTSEPETLADTQPPANAPVVADQPQVTPPKVALLDAQPIVEAVSEPAAKTGAAVPDQTDMAKRALELLALLQDKAVALDWGGVTYRPAPVKTYMPGAPDICGVSNHQKHHLYCPDNQVFYVDAGTADPLFGSNRTIDNLTATFYLARGVAVHLQAQLGILQKVKQRATEFSAAHAAEMHRLLTLQSDCIAAQLMGKSGVSDWSAVRGDVTLLLVRAGTYAAEVGDNFSTLPSNEQRKAWINKGANADSIAACDTFKS